MKRWIAVIALVVGLCGAVVLTGRYRAQAQVAGGGVTIGNNVTNAANGTKIFNANPLRVVLVCQNTGTTNNIFVAFGAVPTTTNGFLLTPNGGWLNLPTEGCNTGYANGRGTGCVPTGTVQAIAAGSGTNTLICWED